MTADVFEETAPLASKVAVLKQIAVDQDRRISALESAVNRISWGMLTAAAGSVVTLALFILEHFVK